MDQIEQEFSDAVLQAVDAGRKIEAIKLLREETGLDLKEARHAIDQLARDRPRTAAAPSAMSEQGGAQGLLKLIAVVAVLVVVYKVFVAS